MSMVNREALNPATESKLREFLGKLTREAKCLKFVLE